MGVRARVRFGRCVLSARAVMNASEILPAAPARAGRAPLPMTRASLPAGELPWANRRIPVGCAQRKCARRESNPGHKHERLV